MALKSIDHHAGKRAVTILARNSTVHSCSHRSHRKERARCQPKSNIWFTESFDTANLKNAKALIQKNLARSQAQICLRQFRLPLWPFHVSFWPLRPDLRSATIRRILFLCKGQLQLQRRSGMQLAPQFEQSFRHPLAEAARMMQLHVATDAQRNEQGLRVALVAMVDHEPARRSTGATLELITLKNQIPQTAEPAQRIVLAVITKPATAQSLQFNWPAPTRTEESQLGPLPFWRRL